MTDYSKLRAVLDAAFEQSSAGKGKERHANGRPFDRQPILEISRMVGTGYATGQVMKKCQEAHAMAARGEHDRAIAEMLGAIVYSAAAAVLMAEAKAEATQAGNANPVRYHTHPTPKRDPAGRAIFPRSVEDEVASAVVDRPAVAT